MADLISTFTTELAFQPLAYEHQVVFPVLQQQQLKDVYLTFFGYPAPTTGFGIEDLRFYLNGIELTDAIRKQLKAEVVSAGRAAVLAAYKSAAERWLALEDAMGGAYPGDAIADKQAF